MVTQNGAAGPSGDPNTLKLANRTIRAWLENEHRAVSYRELAREVGVHVDMAKNLLLQYHSAAASKAASSSSSSSSATPKCTATYLLTGPLLASSSLTQARPRSPSPSSSALAQGTQMVRIVDMDEVSDDERNSEAGDGGGLGDHNPLGREDDPMCGPEGGTLGDAEDDEEEAVEEEEADDVGLDAGGRIAVHKTGGAGGIDTDGLMGNDKGAVDGLEGGSSGVVPQRGSRAKKTVRVGREERVRRDATGKDGTVGAGRWGVVLCREGELETKKQLFDEGVTVHIYALSPGPVKDPALLLIPSLTVRQHPKYRAPEVYGTLTGEAFVTGPTLGPAANAGAGRGPMKDGGMDFGKKSVGKKQEPAPAHPAAKTKTEPATATKESKPAAPKEEDVKPPISAKETPNDERAKEAKSAKPRASTQSQRKRRVVDSDPEEDDDRGPSSEVKEELEEVQAPAVAAAQATPQLTSSARRAEDDAAMMAMMDMDVDLDEGSSPVKSKRGPQGKTKAGQEQGRGRVEEETAGGRSKGGRKKRMVTKSRMTTDDRGRMVTKDYQSEESYTGSESESGDATSKQAAAGLGSRGKVKTEPGDRKPIVGSGSSAHAQGGGKQLGKTGSTASAGSAGSGAGGAAGGGAAAKKAAGGGATAGRGQSTLAGFFKPKPQ